MDAEIVYIALTIARDDIAKTIDGVEAVIRSVELTGLCPNCDRIHTREEVETSRRILTIERVTLARLNAEIARWIAIMRDPNDAFSRMFAMVLDIVAMDMESSKESIH